MGAGRDPAELAAMSSASACPGRPASVQRVTAVRKCPRHVRTGPKPAALPRYTTDRNAAELRELLGKVLDCVDSLPAALDDGQREVLGQALADAGTHRDPSGFCPACEAHPAGLCDDHAADLDLTDAYLALATELRLEVNR